MDVEKFFNDIARMSSCHLSKIKEWLPWVGRHKMAPPRSFEEWKTVLRGRFDRKNQQLGIQSPRAFETFTVTAWGAVPTFEQLLNDFPAIAEAHSNLAPLKERLARWS